jgi:uncharacterized protein (TIGR02453 family)
MRKDILTFLNLLAENNHKEWLDKNKEWYLEVKTYFLGVVDQLLKDLVEIEPAYAALSPKDCVFRQNRDVRFSPNKNPYKNNMAAYFSEGGKKSDLPGYYLHVQPGASFVGGGIYAPGSEVLKRIRQEIDYSGKKLEIILNQKEFREQFGSLEGDSLKTSPRNYSPDHPYIKYLKLKSFTVSRPLSDDDILSGKFLITTRDTFKIIKPLNDFLHQATDGSESGIGLF